MALQLNQPGRRLSAALPRVAPLSWVCHPADCPSGCQTWDNIQSTGTFQEQQEAALHAVSVVKERADRGGQRKGERDSVRQCWCSSPLPSDGCAQGCHDFHDTLGDLWANAVSLDESDCVGLAVTRQGDVGDTMPVACLGLKMEGRG